MQFLRQIGSLYSFFLHKKSIWLGNSSYSILFKFTLRYQSNTAADVLDTITNIQPKESGGGVGETREAIVYRIAEDMLDKLPPDYVPHEVIVLHFLWKLS